MKNGKNGRINLAAMVLRLKKERVRVADASSLTDTERTVILRALERLIETVRWVAAGK